MLLKKGEGTAIIGNSISEREDSMMRRTLAFLAVMILVLGLAACGSGKTPETSAPTTVPTTVTEPTTEPTTVPTTAPTEPQPAAVVGGIDLYGMSLEEAAAAMNESAAAYKLSLTVNGKKLTVSAEELGLKLDEAALRDRKSVV